MNISDRCVTRLQKCPRVFPAVWVRSCPSWVFCAWIRPVLIPPTLPVTCEALPGRESESYTRDCLVRRRPGQVGWKEGREGGRCVPPMPSVSVRGTLQLKHSRSLSLHASLHKGWG